MRLLRWLGPLLTLVLVAAAALASLFGPAAVARVAGSLPFIGLAAALAAGGLWVGIAGLVHGPRRNVVSALIHLGLALGIAGVAVNQHWSTNGYLFLESSAGPAEAYLSRDFATLEVLAAPVALDSLGLRTARGFRPAPAAFISGPDGSSRGAVTYNYPLRSGPAELVFLRTVDPGFLREYELSINDDVYLLLHNQRVRLPDGRDLWSFAVDPELDAVGLMIGPDTAWLSPGTERIVGSTRLLLGSCAISSAPGAIFIVRDTRLRPLVFTGFGLALLGLLLSALRRRST